ncbi:MAG: hypothetical protein ACK57V_13395 [Pirellula sp.]|jgi:hypothetical protein
MSQVPVPAESEVDLLLKNAQLRDELEPYLDESVDLVTLRQMSLSEENEFLASILAWERAPTLPISQWFEPELKLPNPESMSDAQVKQLLWQTIGQLYDQRVVLDLTDHLSDRQLYCLIARDILPSYEKRIADHRNYLHWHCLQENDMECWLKYYATDCEREQWQEENDGELPPREAPPFSRQMPRRPSNFG